MGWVVLLFVLVPPSIFAAARPTTPRWRAAWRVYWILLPITLAIFAYNLNLLDPAGPQWWFYGMWGLFAVCFVAVWSAYVICRIEWNRRKRALARDTAATERSER